MLVVASTGGDGPENLVYCCQACNRLKGDFWPGGDPLAATRRLLHPGRDDVSQHLRETDDGRVVALTATGAFHIERLRLNRPPWVALRRGRQEAARLREQVAAAHAEQARLRERIRTLERDLEGLLEQLGRLLEP